MDRNTSLFGKFFDIIEKKENGLVKAKCRICPLSKPPLSGRADVNSNFLQHLKRKHPKEEQEYRAAKKTKFGTNEEPNPKETQSSVSSFTAQCTQAEADRLITSLFIKSFLPLTIVERPEFQNLIERLSGGTCQSMNSKILAVKIDDEHQVLCRRITSSLHDADYVCTTADVWSDKHRGVLYMTAHIIEKDTLARKSFAIAFENFEGAHSYGAIAEKVQQVHERFGLTPAKVMRVVTDNFNNFSKAFRLGGLKEVGSGKGEPLLITEDIKMEAKPFKSELETDPEVCKEDLEDHQRKIQNDVAFKSIPKEQDPEFPKQEKCKSYVLNLVCTQEMKSTIYPDHHKRLHDSAFAKATALWNECNRPKSIETITDMLGKCLVIPCMARCTSLYESLKCLLEFSLDQINDVMNKLKLAVFSDAELAFVNEYCKVLAPIAAAIDKCQEEANCYYGFAIPVIRQVKGDLQKIADMDLKYNVPLVDAAIEGIEKRFKSLLEQNDDVTDALLATASHPFFKLKPFVKKRRGEIKQKLIKEAQKHALVSGQNFTKEEAKDDYFDFESDDETDVKSHNDNADKLHKASSEVLKFLGDPDNSMGVLQRYPIVKEVFLKFNTPLVSSAPVEQLFPFGSICLDGRRGSLSYQDFGKLVLLEANVKD